MTRTSTASSSTEAEAAERATRRQFFRLFGRQTVNGAGSVLAGVAALRQTGQDALDELLAVAPAVDTSPPAEPELDALRSPYRVDGDRLLILDQRQLPGMVVTIACHDASEVAAAIRTGVLGAGPVLGQVAAYAIALAAEAAVGRPSYAMAAALRGAADTLRAARPINRPLSAAVGRVLAAAEAADDRASAARAEAELIAMEAALDHAAIGKLGAQLLATASEGELALLFIGDLGPLAGGMVGPGFALIQSLAALDRPADVWLADGAPLAEGRRAAWQLAALDVSHTLVPDAGIGWLLANRRIDALLLRAEWVCANGDAVTALGGRAAAGLARDAGIPAYAVAPATVIDPATPDATSIPTDLRMPVPATAGRRLDPAADVVPGALLSGQLRGETD